MCERYDRKLDVDKGGERMRREVYLSRLWTDSLEILKGRTQIKLSQKRGGEREKEGKKRQATEKEGISERTRVK